MHSGGRDVATQTTSGPRASTRSNGRLPLRIIIIRATATPPITRTPSVDRGNSIPSPIPSTRPKTGDGHNRSGRGGSQSIDPPIITTAERAFQPPRPIPPTRAHVHPERWPPAAAAAAAFPPWQRNRIRRDATTRSWCWRPCLGTGCSRCCTRRRRAAWAWPAAGAYIPHHSTGPSIDLDYIQSSVEPNLPILSFTPGCTRPS